MKSCQTSSPSSSHRSWKASVSYAPMPGQPDHVHAPRRARPRGPIAGRPRVVASPTVSVGVQSAPRAKTRTPLTWRSRPSRSMSCVSPGPAASVRKPTRPASTAIVAAPVRRAAGRRAARGSPWVCGHQRSTVGDPQLATDRDAVTVRRRGRARPRDARTGRRAPAGPRPARSPSSGADAPSTAQDAGRRRRGAAAAQLLARRGRAAAPARPVATARPPAGPGANPGARPSEHGPEPAEACRRRRARSASARAACAGPREQRRERAGTRIDQLVRRRGAGRRRRSRGDSNIDSTSRSRSPLSVDLGERRDPVEAEDDLLAAPPPGGLEGASGTTSPRRRGPAGRDARRRAGRRAAVPGTRAGQPGQAVRRRSVDRPRRRPSSRSRLDVVAVRPRDARRPRERHGVSDDRVQRAHGLGPRRPPARRAPRSGRTAAGARA